MPASATDSATQRDSSIRLAWRRRRDNKWHAQLVSLHATIEQAPSGRYVWEVVQAQRCGDSDTLSEAKRAAEQMIASTIGWQSL